MKITILRFLITFTHNITLENATSTHNYAFIDCKLCKINAKYKNNKVIHYYNNNKAIVLYILTLNKINHAAFGYAHLFFLNIMPLVYFSPYS